MLQFIKISTSADPYFGLCWNLYKSSFPECERRDIDYLKATLTKEPFSLEAIVDDGLFVGFVGWWQFDKMLYIEHLATVLTLRGRGYGAMILDHFAAVNSGLIILEVEHPLCSLSRRRIEFYKREGFVLNRYDFRQPSYSLDSSQSVSLMIMSYPAPLSQEEFETFKCECYAQVHFLRDH